MCITSCHGNVQSMLRGGPTTDRRIQYSIIMVLTKIAQKPVHGTTIVPHDGQQLSMFFCFAPARVKVKHYDYDPIGTWGKWRPRGPQNVKQRTAEHFAKKEIWPPRAICYAMGKVDVWGVTACHPILPVDIHACATACCQSSPASQLCKSNVQQLMTKIAPMLSWQLIEIGVWQVVPSMVE